MTTQFPLFSQVALAQDFSEYNLKRGDIATIVEHYEMTDQEDGYSLEGFDIPEITLEVSQSQIMPLTQWQKEQKILEKIYQLPVDKLEKLDAYLNQLIA